MTTQHTQGRLKIGERQRDVFAILAEIDECPVGGAFSSEDARRLVAAWNYAEMLGMFTEELELAEQPLYSRRQHEAIMKMRMVLSFMLSSERISNGERGLIKQALKDTEEFK